jgi:isoleucyl-tRNA synthetase
VRDKADGTLYLLAEARLAAYYKKPELYETRFVEGRRPPRPGLRTDLPVFAGTPGAFRILNDGFVSTEDGTGFVHMAPAFGEDDFRVCKAAGIPLRDYLDDVCAFTESVPEYHGIFCKDADKQIIRSLKDAGKLVHQSTLVHSYPFCPRTDTPLIYRAIEAWYVRVEDLRDKLAANNDTASIGCRRPSAKSASATGSRKPRTGTSPATASGAPASPCGFRRRKGHGLRRLHRRTRKLSGQPVTDLHKHHVDKITFALNGKTYRRTPEVLDCWFESGSMPYAQQHYPFERANELDKFFPADFIAEGLDQTRGWFYTLMLLGTALFDKSPYKNVIVNGLVLAEDGRKMSKRLKNYPDPMHILNTYGADALRLYMINSPIVRAEDLCFSEAGVVQSLRHLLIPWWNAYSFLVTYANVDGWSPRRGAARGQETGDRVQDRPPTTDHQPSTSAAAGGGLMDRWILSTLDRLTGEVVAAMDAYDLQQAVRPLVQFIDDLTNWYIRRSRRRFWKSEDDADKIARLRNPAHRAPAPVPDRRALHAVHLRGDLPQPAHPGPARIRAPLRLPPPRRPRPRRSPRGPDGPGAAGRRPRPPAALRLQPQGAPAAGHPARRLPRRGAPGPRSARWPTSWPTSSTSRKSASAATKARSPNSPPRPTTRPSAPSSAAS